MYGRTASSTIVSQRGTKATQKVARLACSDSQMVYTTHRPCNASRKEIERKREKVKESKRKRVYSLRWLLNYMYQQNISNYLITWNRYDNCLFKRLLFNDRTITIVRIYSLFFISFFFLLVFSLFFSFRIRNMNVSRNC